MKIKVNGNEMEAKKKMEKEDLIREGTGREREETKEGRDGEKKRGDSGEGEKGNEEGVGVRSTEMGLRKRGAGKGRRREWELSLSRRQPKVAPKWPDICSPDSKNFF